MKVSILVPVYGVEKYIERCARSLFGQTYEDLEFVFVDDCSPDRSIAILRQVMERYPKRRSQIKIIHHQVNEGVAAARKTAITHASGDFLMFVDADDYISLEATSLLVNIQKTSAADIVSGDVLAFNAKTKKEISTPRIKSPHDLLLLLLRWKAIPSLWARS
jgi:glycosyltransferase involved in cell wall biosynthesis